MSEEVKEGYVWHPRVEVDWWGKVTNKLLVWKNKTIVLVKLMEINHRYFLAALQPYKYQYPP